MGAIGRTLKIVSLIGFIIAVLVSVFGFLALRDANDFKERLPVEPNIFLLVDGGDILAGAKNMMHESNPEAVTEEEMAVYQQLLDNEDYKNLLGRNYKVFIVYTKAFGSTADAEIGDTGYTKDLILESLGSDSVRDLIIEKAIKETIIPKGLKDVARAQIEGSMPSEQELRTMMFMLLLGAAAEEQGPIFLINEYKAGNIDIYPETILFKFIGMVPESIIENIASGESA